MPAVCCVKMAWPRPMDPFCKSRTAIRVASTTKRGSERCRLARTSNLNFQFSCYLDGFPGL